MINKNIDYSNRIKWINLTLFNIKFTRDTKRLKQVTTQFKENSANLGHDTGEIKANTELKQTTKVL